jgi:Na+-transporting NADH:ubiquinone oxidoreductase subunit NqrB
MINSAPDTAPSLLHVSTPPHIRQSESVPSIMLSVIIALMPAIAASVVFFGVYALLVIGVCVVAAVGSETLLCYIFRKPVSAGDLSAMLTGLLLGLTLPPRLPLWMAAAGSVFAIAVVKIAFGGLGHNIVNPALAGRAFLMVAFPAAMSSWTIPAHGTLCGLQRGLDGISAATPLVYFKSAMASGIFNSLDFQDALPGLFFGNVGGSLGATSGCHLRRSHIPFLPRDYQVQDAVFFHWNRFSAFMDFQRRRRRFFRGFAYRGPVPGTVRRHDARRVFFRGRPGHLAHESLRPHPFRNGLRRAHFSH